VKRSGKAGFTIVEVIVAMLIMTTGLLAIAAGSGSVFRMLGSGRRSTLVSAVAQARLETLRRDANRTVPRCTALSAGSAIQSGGITERWLITTSGNTRIITEIVTQPTPRGTSMDTVIAIIECL
jgi:prepilin-type N-terminal cleavage/methylation domain-containing protein